MLTPFLATNPCGQLLPPPNLTRYFAIVHIEILKDGFNITMENVKMKRKRAMKFEPWPQTKYNSPCNTLLSNSVIIIGHCFVFFYVHRF